MKINQMKFPQKNINILQMIQKVIQIRHIKEIN